MAGTSSIRRTGGRLYRTSGRTIVSTRPDGRRPRPRRDADARGTPMSPGLIGMDTQVRFVGPAGMQIGWHIPAGFAENQLTTPARHNFHQGATYRLKLTKIPARDAKG